MKNEWTTATTTIWMNFKNKMLNERSQSQKRAHCNDSICKKFQKQAKIKLHCWGCKHRWETIRKNKNRTSKKDSSYYLWGEEGSCEWERVLGAAGHAWCLDLCGSYKDVYFTTFIKLNIYVVSSLLLYFYNKKVLKQKIIPVFPSRNTTIVIWNKAAGYLMTRNDDTASELSKSIWYDSITCF